MNKTNEILTFICNSKLLPAARNKASVFIGNIFSVSTYQLLFENLLLVRANIRY